MKKYNSFSQFKAGAKKAPPFLIILYIIFVGLDIYTTYLASPHFKGPDLKHEGNIVTQYFQMTWNQVITVSAFGVLLMTIFLSLGLEHIDTHYREIKRKCIQIVNFKLYYLKLLISVTILILFYSHFIYSIFVTINNYLGYIHVFKIENSFTKISTWYINTVTINQPYFHLYCQFTSFIAAIVVTEFKVKRISKKYEMLQSN